MIFVDVYVPAIDEKYDFELDEEEKVDTLVREVVSLIEHKEKLNWKPTKNRFFYDLERECLLKQEDSLIQKGVKSGDRLILI